MMMALQLHLHRISALSIDSNNDSGHFIRGVLDIWSDWGTNSSLRSLAVDWCPPWSDTVLKLPRKSRASHSTEHVLRNLDTLHLRYVMFKWESSIYNGLIDLQLDFEGDPVWIPFPKLANILITCPALATLKLSHLHILEEWNQMQRLEYVNLVHMEPEDAGLVLSVITLPGPRVELGITYSRKGTPDNRLAGFFARSKVTTLYYTCCDWCESCSNDRCCKSKSFKASEFFPRYLPHVQTLILRNFDLSVTNVDQTSALPPPTPLQSQLQGLILLKCTVDSEALNRLVLEIGVQELHLEQCKTDNLLEGDQRQQELQTMQASLRKIYPQLRCRISSIDSTENLSCRTIFD
ncbi:hypothetical protein FRC09_020855 [Ceratobasidium sp. 395]|nr:hypothetical protein FRC09_020855 [Ceratobasidium sp. 395]